MKVTKLIVFRNANVAAFGEDGRQIPELQMRSLIELWGRFADSLGYDVDGCHVSVDGVALELGVDHAGVVLESGDAAKGA